MFQRSFLTGLACSLLVVQACGSDSGKKNARGDSDAGMGGEAGSGEGPDSGGSSAGKTTTAGNGGLPVAGTAGTGGTSAGEGGTGVVGMAGEGGADTGSGGEAGMPGGGEGGAPNVGQGGVANGGEGGAPVVPPDPEVLFTVQSGAEGLEDTAISAQANPQNVIYASSTGSQEPLYGTNTVKIIGAELGLAATDSIVAFTELQQEPENPIYAFSVVDGTEGASPTDVYDAYWFSDSPPSNVYFSDATRSYRELGEGGDEYGYNGLLMHGPTLGAGVPDGGEGGPDNLRGLMFHDANQPITELYFTTDAGAVGLAGGTIEATPADERGCTVFKSELDGTASVAFSCADLGLAVGDQIDGLLVYGDGAPSEVIFSVTTGSVGVAGSAVEAAVTTGAQNEDSGATLFRSVGDDTNSVYLLPIDLGLGYEYDDDELDALAVMNGRAGSVANAGSCNVTYDPYDVAEGGLTGLAGSNHIGSNILLLSGSTGSAARVLAYNADTCAFLQQQDLPAGFEYGDWAIVPLQGWSAATPLANVEYLRAYYDDQLGSHVVARYDATGAFQTAASVYLEYTPMAMIYEPVNDSVYLVADGSYSGRTIQVATIPRPTADDPSLEAEYHWLGLPCNYNSRINGTDQDGNLYLTQLQGNDTDYRVCGYTRYGALLPLPYSWTPPTTTEELGFLNGRGTHYSFTTSDGLKIERGDYTP